MTSQVLIGKVIGVLKSINFRQAVSLINRFKFSITIVPEGTSYINARTFSFWKVGLFLYLFGTFCAIITGMLMVYTPLNSLFFNQSYQLSHYQVESLRKLDSDIKYLMNEVERLRENNIKLQNAIDAGDSTALKPFLHRTEVKKQQQPGVGGNFLEAFEWFCLNAGKEPGRGLPQEEEKNTAKSVTAKPELRNKLKPAGNSAATLSSFIEFHRPCDGIISGHFAPQEGHYGTDYSINIGSPVFASLNGYVVFADYTADDGNMIIVAHTGGYITVYKHCLQVLRKPRQRVVQGEVIALSGNTGRLSYGPHLHFELWKDGVSLDSELYINEK